jgi:calcium channel MID1
MQFPKLTPLQKRLAACLLTFVLLAILFFSLSPRNFAYAADLDSSFLTQDHNHHRIPEWLSNDIDWGEEQDLSVAQYQADFVGFDRSIIGRADSALMELKGNTPVNADVSSGQTQYFVFLNSSVWADYSSAGNGLPPGISFQLSGMAGLGNNSANTDMTSRNVYISVNTCTQPGSNSTTATTAPQLTLYVSTTNQNQNPGPGQPGDLQSSIQLEEGWAGLTVTADTNDNVYVGVSAPNSTSGISQWSFDVAASIDDFTQYATTTQFSYVLDTDSNNALVSTYNLTISNDSNVQQQWINLGSSPPFQLFVVDMNLPALNGVRNSYCGISKLASAATQTNSSITTRNIGNFPKQQFYVEGLDPNHDYASFLAYVAPNQTAGGSSTVVSGGGQIWSQVNFTTKSGT